jgi:hypothetical protein
VLAGIGLFCWAAVTTPAQQITETRDPKQVQDEEFAKLYKEWTGNPNWGSPLVDHLPKVAGVPTPKDVLGYDVGAPKKLTYYADLLKFYRALEKALPNRVKVETIGKSDENRELVVVWVSSDANMKALKTNRDNLGKLADPRGLSDAQIQTLISTTKPHYHLMGGLHSGETGPSEMLMELVYRLATETSPIISKIRDNVYVSVTPVADADGRDRNVDWHYYGLDAQEQGGAAAGGGGGFGGGGGIGQLPYWGKYVFHDNNRDINLSQMQMRTLTDWYFTAHPPIMHDLHESLTLMYTYSGGPPQNPNLDPLLFSELPWFSNFEMAQMAKWGMPGVYTHGFMDGWSPGYLGSVAYNHNGMMKMYETQSGRDGGAGPAAGGDAPAGRGAAPAAAGAAAGGGAAGAGAAAAGGRGGAGGGGRGGGRGAGGGAAAAAPAAAGAQGAGRAGAPAAGEGAPGGGGGGRGQQPPVPTGQGGGQPREWYRGIPVPPGATNVFSRRNNTNYMETGVLSSLMLASTFPQIVVENFYVKTRNSIEEGKTKAPYAFVIPVQRDMTKAADLVNVLRAQMIEVGVATADIKIGDTTYPAGSYVIKRDQPYGRLAKNLLEKQDYPDPRLTTYDDSGWTMGYAFNVTVKPIDDKSILTAAVTPVTTAVTKGTFKGTGTTGMAIAHFGSNNMISFRYATKNIPMKVAEAKFTAEGVEFPAGSFIVTGGDLAAVKAAADKFGLTAANLSAAPTVATHDADMPRVAIYSQWSQTQELGWYRFTFDKYGIPFDLIYKERVEKGDLKKDYDVIVMAMQNINRQTVMAPKAAKPQPYKQYGSTDDMSGGFGQAGVDAFGKFLEQGGTLIAVQGAVRFPIEFGWARTVDVETPQGMNAQKPLVNAEISNPNSQIFYGYENTIFPVKFTQGAQTFRVGMADQNKIAAKYVGGDAAVLSGLGVGMDAVAGKAFVVDVPGANNGHGRVVLFANNPIYRWQNFGEFNMVFNTIINWNDAK